MKTSDAHNATVKTLRQTLNILDENPKFLREYLMTRLEDLGDTFIKDEKPELPSSTKKSEKEPKDRMADKWKNVLRFMGKGRTSNQEVVDYIHKNKLPITVDSIRSQLAGYVNTGILNRVERGVYELTETGAERIGYDAN